ncbi:MAG TPA: VCBS repeat-containing protein [Planctomycetota bacterium]|nr:VCBS repeat-containing protein [Planctomycetota bacterium]
MSRPLTLRRVCVAACWIAVAASVARAQQSASPFHAPHATTELDVEFAAAPDYDGDGLKDLVGVWMPDFLTGTVTLQLRGYRNLGGGEMALDWTTALGPYPASVKAVVGAAADFDGDGLEDVVVLVSERLMVLYSGGAGAPPSIPWMITLPVGQDAWGALGVADFDLDGDPDVAATTINQLRIYGMSGQSPPTLLGSTPTTWRDRLSIADVDAVPPLDVVVAGGSGSAGGGAARYAVVGGSPVFQGMTPHLSQGIFVHLATGDVDGDGDDDVVVSGDGFTRRIARRTGPATFVDEPYSFGPTTDLLGDLDGDGDLDFIGGHYAPNGTHLPAYGNVAVARVWMALNDGTGGVVLFWNVDVSGVGRIAGVLDLDQDGDRDVVAGRSIVFGRQDAVPPYPHLQTLGRRDLPRDLDADGDLDLRLSSTDRVAGDGSGVFAAVAPPPPPGVSAPGAPCDADGDGDLDLIVHGAASLGTPAPSRLLANLGGGLLVDSGPCTPPGASFVEVVPPFSYLAVPDGAALALDVDLDGDEDVVVRAASGTQQFSRVWINGGAGFFTPGFGWMSGWAEAMVDLNGDELPDALVRGAPGGLGYAALTPWFQTPSGAFIAAPSPAATAVGAGWPVGFGDADGDGDVDLAAQGQAGASVLFNDGLGAFPTSAAIPVAPPAPGLIQSPDARGAFLGDFDGDGVVDVLLARAAAEDNAAAFVRGLGGGAFAAPKLQTFTPWSVGDVDGDRDVDAIAQHHVVQNATFGFLNGGLRRQYGAGAPGAGGVTPVFGADGTLRASFPTTLRAAAASGGADGFLIVGATPVAMPMFGGTLHASLDLLLPVSAGGAPGAPGAGAWSLAVTAPPSLVGMNLFCQIAWLDGAAPFGVSATGGLHLRVGS